MVQFSANVVAFLRQPGFGNVVTKISYEDQTQLSGERRNNDFFINEQQATKIGLRWKMVGNANS